ncbi:UTP--glucose-1-phosphate uridylyltransferase [Methanogenium organophilum]|uniref:UTP--glucose-1-phosphate uridylyltransferase n=1 Tax=Methanogenium organophilum TaxID=2199 RepID=A0A9X9T7B8_METOG|nr:UTP--glucose-1-phosphate uridylyltransferase [Methanogenium organophilum]WAI01193.1 UTP--glucose-1-phosphate uridylyltransferase [Methanogenium organophilum]
MPVKKAVIPAAGFGIRFLPVTKAQPKEMLPVVNKPVIQYVIEETYQSDIHQILLITGRHKRAIEDHLDKANINGHSDLLEEFEELLEKMQIFYIRQKKQSGLGDAVSYAESFIDGDPFALLLGDNITLPNCTKELVDIYEQYNAPVIAIEEIPDDKIKNHGVIKGKKVSSNIFKIEEMVEKPDEPISNLAIIGRYILTPDIFDYLSKTDRGLNGELQLTDALRDMVLDGKEMYAAIHTGRRYDLGNSFDWLKANIELALEDNEIGVSLRNCLNAKLGN